MAGGERLSLLIGNDGLPDPHIAHYTLSCLRSSGNNASSIEKTLHGLEVARLWAQKRGIDLTDRARVFAFLSSGELLDFKDFVRRPFAAIKQVDQNLTTEKFLVGPNSAKFRFNAMVRYLEWLGQEYLARLGNAASSQYLAARDRLDRFVTLANASGKFGATSDPSKPRWGLTSEQREVFLEIIRPGHEANPFQSVHQHRNYALMLFYYEFGMRLAEPLTLRLVATKNMQSSVDLTGSYSRDRGSVGNAPAIWLVRNHDDPDDPRADQPVLKTNGRLLLFRDDGLALAALIDWVNHHRNDETKYPGGKRSPFLFVSRQFSTNTKGRPIAAPLSKKQVMKLFTALQTHNPILKGLTSHVLRHDWNDRWNDRLMDRGERWEDHVRDQCYAMGWDPQSKMPHRYGRRSIQQQANRISMQLQERALSLGGQYKKRATKLNNKGKSNSVAK